MFDFKSQIYQLFFKKNLFKSKKMLNPEIL